MENKLNVDVCICAYNEEANISNLLTALLNQKTKLIEISNIVVVSSGSTDKTNDITKEFIKKK